MSDSLIQILRRGVVEADARGNRGKRKRKKNGKNEEIQQQIQARCVSQIPGCETLANDSCGNNAACAAAIRQCSQSLATCEFGAFFTCATEVLNAEN